MGGAGSSINNLILLNSLVPTTLHTIVARQCVDAKTNLVTASYVSPELASLHDSAQEAGVVIMNECGLDPGIDHLLAMDCIDTVHKNNGKVWFYDIVLIIIIIIIIIIDIIL